MNHVLNHKILYHIGTDSAVFSMYFMYLFTVCLLSADHISQYKSDVLFMYCIYKIIITAILLSKPNPYPV